MAYLIDVLGRIPEHPINRESMNYSQISRWGNILARKDTFYVKPHPKTPYLC